MKYKKTVPSRSYITTSRAECDLCGKVLSDYGVDAGADDSGIKCKR